MTEEEWKSIMDKQDHRFLKKTKLPDHDKWMNLVRTLTPTTGMLQEMFCNSFMAESVELIMHGIFLYEEGYFDCAFYSLRQSIENMNNMLLLADDEEKLTEWKNKMRFPPDNKIKQMLQAKNDAYNQVRDAIPEVFRTYDDLLKKVNKYIHKQGYDTFYILSLQQNEQQIRKRTEIFIELLKYSIGLLLILSIILDPLSLALSDPEVDAHIHFDPWTEPIPLHVFEEIISVDVISQIKQTQFYKDYREFFLEKEELNEATYLVIRCQHFDVEMLSDIEKQIHLLDIRAVLCFCVLRMGAPITHFYFEDDFIGYSTSIHASYDLRWYHSKQFERYVVGDGEKNIPWKHMYISVYKVFDAYLILQHNDRLEEAVLCGIQEVVNASDQHYRECEEMWKEIQHNK